MLNDFLAGFGIFVGYYVIAASALLIVRFLFKPPRELFRKMLHLACVMSILVLTHAFDAWYLAALCAVAFAALLYPVISYLGKFPKVMELLVQRRDGEIKLSLIMAFIMMAVLIAVFWGWLGEEWKYVVTVSVLAWGFGDAAAALVGKTVGHSPVRHPPVKSPKTWEGTIAMFSVSAVVIFISLMILTSCPWYICYAISMLTAPACAMVELLSPNGIDTVSVPFTAAILIFLFMMLFS